MPEKAANIHIGAICPVAQSISHNKNDMAQDRNITFVLCVAGFITVTKILPSSVPIPIAEETIPKIVLLLSVLASINAGMILLPDIDARRLMKEKNKIIFHKALCSLRNLIPCPQLIMNFSFLST